MSFTIYHNPRCAKSRQTLALLQQNGIEPTIRLYLENALNVEELTDLLQALDLKANQVVRKGEAIFKEHFKGRTLQEDEWLTALAQYPKLIERPIVVNDESKKAIIGRPPENIDILL